MGMSYRSAVQGTTYATDIIDLIDYTNYFLEFPDVTGFVPSTLSIVIKTAKTSADIATADDIELIKPVNNSYYLHGKDNNSTNDTLQVFFCNEVQGNRFIRIESIAGFTSPSWVLMAKQYMTPRSNDVVEE